jgi:hypothetical protein
MLAQRLGLSVIRLSPGGTCRLNPLDDPPAAAGEPSERRTLRRADLVAALAAGVLDRPLTQAEDAALFGAVEHLGRRADRPTLADVAGLLTDPPASLVERLHQPPAQLVEDLRPLGYALDKLLTRSLRGMFDGPTTITLRPDRPGMLLDLAAIPIGSAALPLVMVAAAGWLSALLAGEGPRRVQVIDEAWALLANQHTARYLQTCFKLGRTYGVANHCVTHRPSDLAAQADDGTATAKIAGGLLADAATSILLRQAPDQLALAAATFGLNDPETHILGRLARGRALWKIAGRAAVVQHILSPTERELCDTDQHMRGLTRDGCRGTPGGSAPDPPVASQVVPGVPLEAGDDAARQTPRRRNRASTEP